MYLPTRKRGSRANRGLSLRRLPRIAAVLAAAGLLCGCSSGQQLRSWIVPPEYACSSLAVSFPAERSVLQSIVGANFRPAGYGESGPGRLRVTVYSCPAAASSAPGDAVIAYTVVTIPLAKDSAPLAIAGMDDAAWVSLALYVGASSEGRSRMMRESAFAAVGGESRLSRRPEGDGERMTAQIALAGGELRVSARFSCEAAPFRRRRIAVGTGSMNYSLLFGEMAGRHCSSSRVSVEATGNTPFSDLNLSAHGATAWKAAGMTWNFRLLRNAAF